MAGYSKGYRKNFPKRIRKRFRKLDLLATELKQTDYTVYLKSKYWQLFRRLKVSLSESRCEECGKKSELQVHHNSYKHLGIPDEEMMDTICLCSQCHYKKHFGDYSHLFNKPKESSPDYAALLAIGLKPS